MYAITIRQPFASLIMAGIKTVETRSRATNIRGRVIIHSSKQFDPELECFESDGYGAWPYITRLLIENGVRFDHEFEGFYGKLPRGKILGSVEIVDCIPAGDWIEMSKVKSSGSFNDYDREFALGDLSSDMFCWVLKDPMPWPNPFNHKGQQGFWKFPLYSPENLKKIRGF